MKPETQKSIKGNEMRKLKLLAIVSGLLIVSCSNESENKNPEPSLIPLKVGYKMMLKNTYYHADTITAISNDEFGIIEHRRLGEIDFYLFSEEFNGYFGAYFQKNGYFQTVSASVAGEIVKEYWKYKYPANINDSWPQNNKSSYTIFYVGMADVIIGSKTYNTHQYNVLDANNKLKEVHNFDPDVGEVLKQVFDADGSLTETRELIDFSFE